MFRHLFFFTFCFNFIIVFSQNSVKVKGNYTYKIGENEFFSIAEAKRKAVEQAKISALKEAFGEYYHEDVVDVRTESNNKSSGFFYESTMASVKGIWIKDTKEPLVHVSLNDNGMVIKAEVEGIASEKKASVNIKWSVVGEWSGTIDQNNRILKPNERFFVNFKSPVDGYVAVYLKDLTNNEISCLLPYKTNINGQFHIMRGQLYQLFDERYDSFADEYSFTQPKNGNTEVYKIVLVFSTKPFTKCVDSTGDYKHANSLTETDFNVWINNLKAADMDAVFEERYIVING